DRLGAKVGADQLALGRLVAFVEYEVDHRANALQSLRKRLAGRRAIGDPGVADLALRPGQALAERRLGHEERPGDLPRGEPGDGAQRERDARVGGERGVAAGEEQP